VSGPTTPRWRLLRSTAFSGIATALAALGHVLGGGEGPDVAVLMVGGAAVAGLCMGLSARRRTFSTILGLLAASQLTFHALFSIDVHAMARHSSMLPNHPGRMLAFHLLAIALSALVLAKGDAALFGLFGALRRAVRLVRPPSGIDLPPGWTAAVADFSVEPAGALLSTSPGRGPPATR